MIDKNETWFEHISLEHIKRAIAKADTGLLRTEDDVARNIFANLKSEVGGPQDTPRTYDTQLQLADELRAYQHRLRGPISVKRIARAGRIAIQGGPGHKDGEGMHIFDGPLRSEPYAEYLQTAVREIDVIVAALEDAPAEEFLSPHLRQILADANAKIEELYGSDQYRISVRPIRTDLKSAP